MKRATTQAPSPKPQALSYSTLNSPLGELLLVADDAGIRSIHFPSHKGKAEPMEHWRRDDSGLGEARAQLAAYFSGELREFSLPLNPRGTPFQKRVWKLLVTIPYGTTTTYGALARRLRMPSASRAVGAANGRNPISIVVPCHRVIGQDGSLTGYAGGLEIKRALLDLESRHAAVTAGLFG